MSGTRIRTAAGIATIRTHWGIIDTSQQGRNDTAITAIVDFLYPETVASTDADTSYPILRTQRRQHLHDLPINLGRDESVTIRIEARHGAHLVLQHALDRQRGRRGEPHQEIPHRPHE